MGDEPPGESATVAVPGTIATATATLAVRSPVAGTRPCEAAVGFTGQDTAAAGRVAASAPTVLVQDPAMALVAEVGEPTHTNLLNWDHTHLSEAATAWWNQAQAGEDAHYAICQPVHNPTGTEWPRRISGSSGFRVRGLVSS